jgi:hypothetical protein
MAIQLINASAYRRALALRDLTDAASGPHAMQLLASRISWICGESERAP